MDKCSNVKHIEFKPCVSTLEDCMDACIKDAGRVFRFSIDIKNVKCRSYIVVGVLIFEDRILKDIKVRELYTGDMSPSGVNNINTGNFYYVFPEDNMNRRRRFTVQTIVQYDRSKRVD